MDIETAFRIKEEIFDDEDPRFREPTPLWLAIKNRDYKMVKFFLRAGSKVNGYVRGQPYSIITFACRRASVDIVKILLDYGAEKWDKELPLVILAAKMYKIDLLNLLISRGFDVNKMSGYKTAITEARDGHNLIKSGRDKGFSKDVMIDVHKICSEEVIKILLAAGGINYSERCITKMKIKDKHTEKLNEKFIKRLKKDGLHAYTSLMIDFLVEDYRKGFDIEWYKPSEIIKKIITEECEIYREVVTEAFEEAGLL